MTSEFEQYVLGGPVVSEFIPIASLNSDGDCFEFIATNETFRAERLDSLVTVYIGRESNEVVGCQIKGISKYVQEVLDNYPSFSIEIRDGRVRLECLFTLRLCEAYREPDGTKVRVYKQLRDAAGRTKAEIEIPRRAA
jgi:hypothetical protein